eukprot:m.46651 g.46651  ORF g.46651 m.46651 type:complete len:257 (-) comp10393_c0_seq5:529-1299(-)
MEVNVCTAEYIDNLIEQTGWPKHLFEDESKKPRVVDTVEEFVHELLLGSHMDDVVVLKDGLTKLKMWDAIPETFINAVNTSKNVRDFLKKLDPELQKKLKTRLYYAKKGKWKFGEEKELKRDKDGNKVLSIKEKLDALNDFDDIADEHMYVAELRYIDRFRHPLGNDWVRTFLTKDMKDYVTRGEAAAMPYWDRFDEGVFVGAHESGSPLHVDQVSWSNVGKCSMCPVLNSNTRKFLRAQSHGDLEVWKRFIFALG